MMTYLKITSLGSPDLRAERKANDLFDHYVKECSNGRDISPDDDNNHSRDIFNDQRNDR